MSVSGWLRREVIRRAGNRCEYCRLSQAGQEAAFHIDHIHPVAEGGETVLENLALACVSCSLRKAARRFARDSGGAHSSRVLAAASRRRELCLFGFTTARAGRLVISHEQKTKKFVSAGRRNQHARRVRYPVFCARLRGCALVPSAGRRRRSPSRTLPLSASARPRAAPACE